LRLCCFSIFSREPLQLLKDDSEPKLAHGSPYVTTGRFACASI
jgi:hypothetical protein